MMEEAELRSFAERIKVLPHYSRALDSKLAAALGEEYHHSYTNYIDSANRLAVEGFSWCTGVTFHEDERGAEKWANVRGVSESNAQIDFSITAATPEIALASAWLFAQAALLCDHNYPLDEAHQRYCTRCHAGVLK